MKFLKKSLWVILSTLFLFLISMIGYMKFTNKNINDIGLSFFQWVKKVKGEEVDLAGLSEVETVVFEHTLWEGLLKKYVTPEGQVNYKGFIADKDRFVEYLDLMSANPPSSNWTESEQLAYWINAYNAFTVKLIIDHYPLKSIKDIAGNVPMINSSWDIKFFKIGGIDFDLNTIEHQILRKQYEEPRIHFAINCASISCPKLRASAFTAEGLELQLEEQARGFINNPIKNKLSSEEIWLSSIFDWFKSDFIKNESLLSFIQKYTVIKLDPQLDVKYLDYNWNLNE